MIGMKRNKAAMIKRRQSLLAVMAVVLILASIGTGYLGFVYDPGEDVPDTPPAANGLDPVSAEETVAGKETTAATEATTPASDNVTAPTNIPMEADGAEAAPANKDGADKAADPTDKPPEEQGDENKEDNKEDNKNDNKEDNKEDNKNDNKEDNKNDNKEDKDGLGPQLNSASGNSDDFAPAFPPSTAATEQPPHSGILINPHTVTQPASEETAPATSEDPTPTVPSEPTTPRKFTPGFRLVMQLACVVFAAGACIDILLLAMLRKNVRDHERAGEQPMDLPTQMEVHPVPITEETVEETVCPIPGISVGKIHDIGRRDYQQDSFGQTAVLRNTGILAVLADGMGGLSGGERVSQKIVMEALTFGSTLQANQVPTALPGMVAGINRAVNQMLGPKGLYTSGSTVVSALITGNALRWISVGDSRIYLYRDGQLSQLSRDHDLLQDWMPDILEGKRSMAEALRDPNGRKLTSFIGMGELRHVDYNRTPIPLLPGDRVLLMSDGVYGTVSDAEMAAILRDCGSVQLAASHIGQRIMGAALPYQDNYTLIVLGYDPPDQPRNNR